MKIYIYSVVFLIWLIPSPSKNWAEDWPQWLGPKRNGVSSESVPVWNSELKPIWSIPIGEGNSSPVVSQNKIVIHSGIANKPQEKVQVFELLSGKLVWEKTYNKAVFKPLYGEGPRSTPAIDQDFVYTFGNTGVLIAWKLANGEKVWEVDTLKEFSVPNLKFGISTSPIVVGDLLIVMVGNNTDRQPKNKEAPGTCLVAYNKKTGEKKWTTGRDSASYSSPILHQDKLYVLSGQNVLKIDPTSGKIIWQIPFVDKLFESSSTLVIKDELIFGSSITSGGICLKENKSSPETKPEVKWKNSQLNCYFSTPIPIKDNYLLVMTGKLFPPPSGSLHCVDMNTGKIVWTKEKVGKYHASILKTGDSRFLILDDSGQLVLLEANTEKYQELAKTKLFTATGDAWAHPALCNGKLIVRSVDKLYCFNLRDK